MHRVKPTLKVIQGNLVYTFEAVTIETREMNHFYGLLCMMMLLLVEASSKEISVLQRTKSLADRDPTNVLSFAFCESSLAAEDKMGKKTLDEVHTYAELNHDPRGSLPQSFTVCSTIMTTGCLSQARWPTFFNILDNNGGQFLGPFLSHGIIESGLRLGHLWR